MDNVRVNKAELLAKIKTNRNNHKATFEEALVGFQEEVIKQLESRIADARRGKRVNVRVDLVEPMDMTKEYDRVIAMLEMAVDDIVEIPSEDFAQYVMDDWHWRGQFIASTSNYLKKK